VAEHDRYRVQPASADFPAATDDVLALAPDADSARLDAGCRNLARLPELSGLRRLWCFGARQRDVDAIAECPALEALYLDDARAIDYSALASLPGLRTLRVEGATRVSSFEQFAGFASLTTLGLEHFPRVRSLEPLAELASLVALEISGSTWTSMKVESLEPLGELTNLRFLRLANLQPADDSLAPLSRLDKLGVLECAGGYPWQEFARLAAQLSGTKCIWFSHANTLGSAHCETCGSAKVVLTGKRQPTLCPRCDAERVGRHQARFLREMARREP
jgi:hypothetical protein